MHELSVCQALLTQVADVVQAHRADAVKRIVVEIGPLSGVEPALLAKVFELARAGGCSEHAELSFETIPVRIRCVECGAESECAANRLLCATCGTFRTQLISGDGLRLLRVELQESARPLASRVD